MKSFEQRKRGGVDPVRLLGKRIILIGLLLVLGISAKAVWAIYVKSTEAAQKEVRAEVRVQSLEMREAELRADIARLHTERGQQDQLREQYEFAKKGEGLIVIVDERPEEPAPEPEFPSFEWFKGRFGW